jgi:calcium binding protein
MTADANIPALLVPESCRRVEDGRPSRRSTAMPKLDKQDQRIADIFGVKEVPDVTPETLARYLAYLKQHLTFPCQLTGIEDLGCFSWEEYYTFGPGSKKEYEQLKKKRASYTDTYELLGFDDEVDPEDGLLVHVRRLSDKKKFTLTLSDLQATDEQTKNYQLLDDFAVWFVNWR